MCSGTEYNFTDCELGNSTRQSNHSEDVGVKCQTSKGIALKNGRPLSTSYIGFYIANNILYTPCSSVVIKLNLQVKVTTRGC